MAQVPDIYILNQDFFFQEMRVGQALSRGSAMAPALAPGQLQTSIFPVMVILNSISFGMAMFI